MDRYKSHPDPRIRLAREVDEPFLWRMLAEAAQEPAQEPAVQAVREDPALAKYVEGWGRCHDLGFVAEGCEGELFGAVWQRLLVGNGRGFGYVDDQTPELGIAVRPEYRGCGIGSQLLGCLLDETARLSYPALSLSVRTDNSAIRLYQRAGFAMVEGSEVANRAGRTSAVMRLELG